MTTTSSDTTVGLSADAHETSGPPVLGDIGSFPSHAELARTLIEPGGMATLATLATSGHPYASIAPYSALVDGAPLICVSSLAEHTQYLRSDPRASVLVEATPAPGVDPLSEARVTMIGSFVPVDPTAEEIDRHLELHPFARNYVHFADFSWWRLEIANLRYVGGFGVMGWSTAEEYSTATADPIIPHATPMIDHLDADHGDACLDIVRHLAHVADAQSVSVSAIDRYGITFDARTTGDAETTVARVAFADVLERPDDVRAASVELVHRARHAAAN
ncbi:MAG: DUF2470 domain-containing protein [Actinomycetota bacterium]